MNPKDTPDLKIRVANGNRALGKCNCAIGKDHDWYEAPAPDTRDLEEQKLENQVDAVWAIVKKDSLASSRIGHPSNETRNTLSKLLHQHHNALLREVEGKLPKPIDYDAAAELRAGTYSRSDEYHEAGRRQVIDQVKQILADARVGEEVVK